MCRSQDKGIKKEVIVCYNCNGPVEYVEKGKFYSWWCPKCKRTVISKSILKEVGSES